MWATDFLLHFFFVFLDSPRAYTSTGGLRIDFSPLRYRRALVVQKAVGFHSFEVA
jgi:hypothetical protein